MAPSTSRLVFSMPFVLVTLCLFFSDCAVRAAHATPLGHVTADIEVLLQDSHIIRRVSAWGLSINDIRHDISAMSPAERVQLVYVLSRRWQGTKRQPQSAQQAQFLVMMSLMRESTLFVSVVSTDRSRLTQ